VNQLLVPAGEGGVDEGVQKVHKLTLQVALVTVKVGLTDFARAECKQSPSWCLFPFQFPVLSSMIHHRLLKPTHNIESLIGHGAHGLL